jgi:hypothetical protein
MTFFFASWLTKVNQDIKPFWDAEPSTDQMMTFMRVTAYPFFAMGLSRTQCPYAMCQPMLRDPFVPPTVLSML